MFINEFHYYQVIVLLPESEWRSWERTFSRRNVAFPHSINLETFTQRLPIQLRADGVTTEPGQNVQRNAEEEHKPEPELVQTQLQLMVVLIVLGRRLKV